MWVFELFGHEDIRLVNGGREKWVAEGRELTRDVPERTPVEYPVVERDETGLRARRDDVVAHLGEGKPLIDVRSFPEYTGERTHMPDFPQESALRGGHIPSAHSVPWARAANEDATFKSREELEQIYRDELGLGDSDDVIAYCRIGERSSHTWFVLKYLLGFPTVRNYDGSWTEWGSLVGAPIVVGEEPGTAPTRWGARCLQFLPSSRKSATTSSRSPSANASRCCSSFPTSCPRCPIASPTSSSSA
jgi:thiosulfate/3-mercaptopyruvate sulfurtransferase